MKQETSEEAGEETIEISHGPEGTTVSLDGVTGMEVLALCLVGVVLVAVLWSVKKRG